ncbi:PEFG-CTERM sorting domain-containing protein [Nitrosopumilus sp. K4]|uniref:PEFG-CTERM sorting domain-containing protein n=1 Tax=Nitrosopumilus sp. K4 TaxID=2795383 RepID=UPI0020138187|nr:PEFG-CTERM sorting domain-containing protein [Nitrosopumilus sp. K4]
MLLVSLSPILVFAEPSFELHSNQKQIGVSDSFLVYGKVSDVTPYSEVNLSVVAPDGEIVYSYELTFDDDGNFKRLIHPPIHGFKIGTYTITASHPQISITNQFQFTVVGNGVASEGVMQETKSLSQLTQEKLNSDMYILANAVQGDTDIKITGKTIWTDRDVTLKVTSPNGNLITVAQVSPSSDGAFSSTIKTGGPLWNEDGMYTVTAYQGDYSELTDTVKVEIANGVVVPEFGTIAIMILAMSIISLIVFSAKSRLSLTPRL